MGFRVSSRADSSGRTRVLLEVRGEESRRWIEVPEVREGRGSLTQAIEETGGLMASSIRDVARQAGLRSGVQIDERTVRRWIEWGLLTGDLSETLVCDASMIALLRGHGFTIEEIARFTKRSASGIVAASDDGC